ncbi:protein-tyrosine phosphatase [Bathymodiolus japonicus methanotrophic gill symbiont]|uniref:low molecular weight protein-tyrosine-phosphatase n=1 Tax=Bathymodiolus japonicus methanotrophic gill symbiont TaxID=113269 RepID=UPI001B629E58|nr:low molecular weight protein-tyrosine-phosphatase [Bathymodiolus japonicus methanotrophic gill symbiont]GFO72478.1 protein-tyrosine phosphatase [Bathymodiolus japonicus methanotrophic gill symbiont]
MSNQNKVKVLFVCMGNICRSPSAEGVFNKLIQEQQLQNNFDIDSAGTHAYHIGEAPDLRSQRAAKDREVDLSMLRARKVVMGDFEDYDYLLAMDQDNHAIMLEACPEEHQHKIKLFLEYASHLNTTEVPDPYFGGTYGFETVLDLIEEASTGFLEQLKKS